MDIRCFLGFRLVRGTTSKVFKCGCVWWLAKGECGLTVGFWGSKAQGVLMGIGMGCEVFLVWFDQWLIRVGVL